MVGCPNELYFVDRHYPIRGIDEIRLSRKLPNFVFNTYIRDIDFGVCHERLLL